MFGPKLKKGTLSLLFSNANDSSFIPILKKIEWVMTDV
jgi:hypothetical protein